MIHPHAQHAIKAVKMRQDCGYYAAWRYVERHGVPTHLYTLARVLDAAQRAGLPK